MHFRQWKRREFITLLGGARSSLQGLLLFTPKSPAAPRNHLVLVLSGPNFSHKHVGGSGLLLQRFTRMVMASASTTFAV
jgi:hypothetical protein